MTYGSAHFSQWDDLIRRQVQKYQTRACTPLIQYFATTLRLSLLQLWVSSQKVLCIPLQECDLGSAR